MKNLLIFAGSDIVACQFLSAFIPQARAKSINPIIIRVQNGSHHWDHPEMKRYSFYENALLNDFIFPYINEHPSPVYKLANIDQLQERYNLQVIEAKKVNDPEFIQKLQEMDFIGAFSIRCFQIFKKPLIDTIKQKGFFGNSHPGLLPEYRGLFCLLRGMVEADKQVGWNLHIVEEGIDTGDVISEVIVPNDGTHNMFELFSHTIPHLVKGWLDFTCKAINGETPSLKAQLSEGRYFTYPTTAEIDSWLETDILKPLSAKEMVQFYCNIMYSPEHKLSKAAQDLKVFMINKIANFETTIEMEKDNYASGLLTQKAA